MKVTQQQPVTDAELEPNDSVDKPFAMPNDRTVVHARWTPGDTDCFAVAPEAAARTLAITIDPPSDFDPAAELFVDGKSIELANKGKKGAQEKLAGNVPVNCKAVVCVKSADPNATGEAAYDVGVQESDSAP